MDILALSRFATSGYMCDGYGIGVDRELRYSILVIAVNKDLVSPSTISRLAYPPISRPIEAKTGTEDEWSRALL